jgi:CPA1 family monovalent cation:H+ antiporter
MHEPSTTAALVAATVSLLLIASLILVVSRRIRLPFTVVLVVIGIVLALLIERYPHELHLLGELEASPELILYVFLPTLIFQSTFNLDVRSLRHNLAPILTLAVPGLVLSTALIGLILWLTTPLPLDVALLLGAILSATDPVAVIAIFERLGAPHRLMILVEGESLFNDATAIVLSRILIGVVAAGTISGGTIADGVIDFFALFVGGLLLGILLGWITGLLLGLLESEPMVEITTTTALAYVAFLLAEDLLHVSGVMAVMGAGLTLGGWGRAKISASVRVYLEQFIDMLAFIATALIFLMVGLKIDLAALWGSLDMLAWVVVAMLVARAVLVFGLMPLVGRIPGFGRINGAYQAVMFWGGLRGAIALAIVLSLPAFEYSQLFVTLVSGAVLFTLIVQGLTIEPLVRWLRLHVPSLADRMALLERELMARQRARERVPELQAGGLFSSAIARRLQQQCARSIAEVQASLTTLREKDLHRDQEVNLLYLHAFAEEGHSYTEMYGKGHLSEGAYRELMLVLTMQIDSVRHQGEFVRVAYGRTFSPERMLSHLLIRLPGLTWLGEKLQMRRVIRNYEEEWGHFQGSGHVLAYLHELQELESTPAEVIRSVVETYEHWHRQSARHLDRVTEQFPEFVASMQERLGSRLILLAEKEVTAEQAERGMLPRGVATELQSDIARRLTALRGQSVERLYADPAELLKRVPLFAELAGAEFLVLARHVKPLTLAEGEDIIRQGETGYSLYLIARGVVQVVRDFEGQAQRVGTLMAGDYFGEMALMHHEPRTATVRTVTPCQLYELHSDTLADVIGRHPEVGEALKRTDAERWRELQAMTITRHVG